MIYLLATLVAIALGAALFVWRRRAFEAPVAFDLSVTHGAFAALARKGLEPLPETAFLELSDGRTLPVLSEWVSLPGSESRGTKALVHDPRGDSRDLICARTVI